MGTFFEDSLEPPLGDIGWAMSSGNVCQADTVDLPPQGHCRVVEYELAIERTLISRPFSTPEKTPQTTTPREPHGRCA